MAHREIETCKEWGITYVEYLRQPKDHRAMMMAYLEAKGRMAAVEDQERRKREFMRSNR